MSNSAEWVPTGKSYRAWVPTNTGLLSFAQIGLQCSTRPLVANYRNGETACVIECIENRTVKLDDSLFGLLSKFYGPIAGKKDTYFILNSLCKHRQKRSHFLTGNIACVYGKLGKRQILPNLKQMIKHGQIWQQLDIKRDIFSSETVFTVKFCLSRKGTCKFFDFLFAENMSYTAEKPENLENYLCSQSYMFLRDMLHRHKHHSPGSDTFIDLKAASNNWKNKIAFSLGKQMIKKPISSRPDTFQGAIGIIAYIRAFQTSHVMSIYTEENLSATKSSLEAEYKNLTKIISDKRWFYGLLISLNTFSYSKFLTWGTLSEYGIGHYSALVIIGTIMLIAMAKTSFYDVRKSTECSILYYGYHEVRPIPKAERFIFCHNARARRHSTYTLRH